MVIQDIMTVSRKEYITPHYLRVYLTGSDATLQAIANTTVGVNNKIFVPPKGMSKVIMPNMLNKLIKPSQQAIRRTYTHSGIDLACKEIWIDFIAHGTEYPASGWAMQANQGDELGIMMKKKSRALFPQTENYLLIGDATAIPLLSAMLVSLPTSAKATCFIEVHGKEDEQKLRSQADVNITWLHNQSPKQGSDLTSAVEEFLQNHTFAETNRYARIACEQRSVKNLRRVLNAQGWQKDEFDASAYWVAT